MQDPQSQKIKRFCADFVLILCRFCTEERYRAGQEDALRVHKAENDHLYPREKLSRTWQGYASA